MQNAGEFAHLNGKWQAGSARASPPGRLAVTPRRGKLKVLRFRSTSSLEVWTDYKYKKKFVPDHCRILTKPIRKYSIR